jgi:hypothetical protein
MPWSRFRSNAPTVVRCREGHLFSTVWVPFASFKAIRLGPRRFQRCPVGNHWTFVSRVRDDELSDAERVQAETFFDGSGL